MKKKLLIVALVLSSFSFTSETCVGLKRIPEFENKIEKSSFDKLEVHAVGIKMYDSDRVQIDYSTYKMTGTAKKNNNSIPSPLGNTIKKIVISRSLAEKMIPESKKLLSYENKTSKNKRRFDISPRKISFNVGENGVKNIYIQNGIIIVD
ncbi:hypothetical protein [Leptotrichia sp. oral taxon 847]|uniref:hypothetical protein n=1 Tax=Leptotrichia sp. oral taxon 847 TaxID=1785996 RepID=UPI000767E151|nr:hypothetical protein [Leptotrichia sp. oral taxon 847]AMD94358.1 hypothetical protein AXF11_01275 [Leptotrichia sp. oral taxon 847]